MAGCGGVPGVTSGAEDIRTEADRDVSSRMALGPMLFMFETSLQSGTDRQFIEDFEDDVGLDVVDDRMSDAVNCCITADILPKVLGKEKRETIEGQSDGCKRVY